MPDSSGYGLVETILFFGVILAFLIWQLIVTRRSIREDLERAQREPRDESPTDRPDRIGDKL